MVSTIADVRRLITAVTVIVTFGCVDLLAEQVPEGAYAAAQERLELIQKDVLSGTGMYKNFYRYFGVERKDEIVNAYLGEAIKSVRLRFDGIESLDPSGNGVIQNSDFIRYVFHVLINDEINHTFHVTTREDSMWVCTGGGMGSERIYKIVHSLLRANADKSNYECYYLWFSNYKYALINDGGNYYIIPANDNAASVLKESVLFDEDVFYLPTRFSDALPFIQKEVPKIRRAIKESTIE